MKRSAGVDDPDKGEKESTLEKRSLVMGAMMGLMEGGFLYI